PLSALQAGIEEEGQLKEDAATTTGRRAAPSSSAAVASPSSLSTRPGGDSVTETVVAAREAIVPTGKMAVEDKKEKQLKKEKRFDKEKPLEDARKQRLEEEQWTNSRSMTPPPPRSKSSCTSTSFQGCQPGMETSDPIMCG
ncbi:MAG: hypothetical protein ACK55Z_00430, partial [bacterium]